MSEAKNFISFFCNKSKNNWTFSTVDEFINWLDIEINFYSGLQNISQFREVSRNRTLIENIRNKLNSSKDISEIQKSQFKRTLEQEYFPAQKFLQNFVQGIVDTNLRIMVVSEIITQGSVQRQNYSMNTEAIILARIFSYYGSLDKILSDVQDANLIIDSVSSLKTEIAFEWENFTTKSKNEIAEISTSARLQAPKDYWERKSSRHSGLIQKSRALWYCSLGINVLILLGSIILTICHPISNQTSLYAIIVRFFWIASFLAISIWWSRQNLRDLRMNEHLFEDAQERITMIETFSALRGEKLSEEDYTIILSALFRPATTGLADDNGPSMPFELLMRLAMKARN